MFTKIFESESASGLPLRLTVIDVIPIALDYSFGSEQKMRLHATP